MCKDFEPYYKRINFFKKYSSDYISISNSHQYYINSKMHDIILCVVIVLLVIWIFAPNFMCGENTGYNTKHSNSQHGYATGAPVGSKPRGGTDDDDYNDYLQDMALDPSIKEQHHEWLDNLQINLQPRMYSIRDDCDDGETKRWGLLKKDYNNVINENQNIAIPSGRTCTEGDGGNSRFGGYGIGLCPVQRP
jgi:hypothetical protein